MTGRLDVVQDDEPLGDQFLDVWQEGADLVLPVDDHDDDREVFDKAQNARVCTWLDAPNPSQPRSTVAPARPAAFALRLIS